MRNRRISRRIAAAAALLVLVFSGGCARQPPSKNTQSGIRLRVTMRFAQAVNPNYLYYFLINNAGSSAAPGPVPVDVPISGQPYGNGFATASDSGASNPTNKAGFTDFVLFGFNQYGGSSQNGYAVYHVVGDGSNRANFHSTGAPVASARPAADPTDPNSATLTFELDLSQLIRDATGAPLLDQNQAATLAQAIQFLQLNIIATNLTPTDTQTSVLKLYDSMGDNRSGASGARGSYLTVDATQNRTYTSTDSLTSETIEPDYADVVNGSDSSLDLRSWTIEVVHTQ